MAEPAKTVKLPPLPKPLLYAVIVGVVASWVPLALIAKARVSFSEKSRVHIIQDMDVQPRAMPQDVSAVFADGRAMRLPVAGTVAHTAADLAYEDDYFRGFETDGNGKPITDANGQYRWSTGLPKQITLSKELLKRGQERFNIYCAPCHGMAGYGDGPINRRALMQGVSSGWVPPVNLHVKDPSSGKLLYAAENYPAGRLFNAISRGVRTMPAYDKQISVEDRWAIVAYVHALQFSQNVPAERAPQGAAVQTISGFMAKVAAPAPAPSAGGSAGGAGDAELVAKGKALFQAKICFTCHQIPGGPPAPVGPSYEKGLPWGKKRKVTAGPGGAVEEVTVDEAYFRESIKEPMKRIAINEQTNQAYPPAMVLPFPVTDEEINALMAYVKSLSK